MTAPADQAATLTRETVFSFLWSHLSEGLISFCCGRAGVKLPAVSSWSGVWDDLTAADRDALRPVLLDLLQGHEERRVEYRERLVRARVRR